MSLADAADYYFAHCETLERSERLWAPDELISVRHEDFVRDPESTLRALCAFLGLDPDPGWLASCRAVVFPAPTRSGRSAAWPDGLAASIAGRAARHAQLASYADAGGSMRTKLG